jgi:multisubunit Na+/H+ antiporter MnhE subunit
MSRKPVYFLMGFIVGAVVSLLWNAMPIVRAGAAPSIPGIWLDIAVQAVIIGLLLGLIVMWFGTWRRNRN